MKVIYFSSVFFVMAILASAPSASLICAQDGAVAVSSMQQELDSVARVGSVMVDGDVCQKIVTPLAKGYMFKVDPRDEFLAGDNYDVDDGAFNVTKKTLIRLSHLTSFPSDVNLWMPIDGHQDKIQMVIRNKNEMSQFWHWGDVYQDMTPKMGMVLKTGERQTVMDRPGWVSVLAPVYNSLGDIVGLIEAVSRTKIDAHENVK
jgi:hypothetical protein